jgi:exo-beta-1,3-glucanase (GH17 family)
MKKYSSFKKIAGLALGMMLNVAAMAEEPEIVVTSIPPIGTGGVAEGHVAWSELSAANCEQYAVIAMLHTAGGDYVKPTYNNYLNPVDRDGNFSVNITTGGAGDFNIAEVFFYFVLRKTFNGLGGTSVHSGMMGGKHIGPSLTVNRGAFWAERPLIPEPDVPPGFAAPGTKVSLSCQHGGTIRYTLDGSDPVASPTARTYTGGASFAVPAAGSLLIKAVTGLSGSYSSVASYLYLPDGPTETPFWGLNVSLALNGESFGHYLDENETEARMEPVIPLTKWVRTFGTLNNGLEFVNKIAKNAGLHTLIGVYVTNDASGNSAQINGLRKILEQGPAPDLIAVGNECSLAGVSEATLISCIDAVRETLRDLSLVIPVGNVDVADASWSLAVLDKLDFAGVNIYSGTWDNTPENRMVAALKQSYANAVAAFPSKLVMLTETGTPYAGGSYTVSGGTQTASVAKAVSFLDGFLQWIHEENIPAFYFEAYDEPVKSKNGGHPVEQYFGIMDGNRQIHSFYREITGNETIPDTFDTANGTSVCVSGRTLSITAPPAGMDVAIYGMGGKLLETAGIAANDTYRTTLERGIYVVRTGEFSRKIVIR